MKIEINSKFPLEFGRVYYYAGYYAGDIHDRKKEIEVSKCYIDRIFTEKDGTSELLFTKIDERGFNDGGFTVPQEGIEDMIAIARWSGPHGRVFDNFSEAQQFANELIHDDGEQK